MYLSLKKKKKKAKKKDVEQKKFTLIQTVAKT